MEFKGTKGNWKFNIENDSNFSRVTILDENNNWIFYSDLRENLSEEEEANFKLASHSKELLEMLEIVLVCHKKRIPLQNYDLNNIEQLIKKSTEL